MKKIYWDKREDLSYAGIIYPRFYINRTRKGVELMIVQNPYSIVNKCITFKNLNHAKEYARKYLKVEGRYEE